MSDLTIGLLSALLATNQPQAVSNLVQQHTGVSVPLVDVNDPAERELRNLMERIVILCPQVRIDARHIPLNAARRAPAERAVEFTGSLQEVRETAEREYIMKKLEDTKGNVSRTAELLGMERSNLYRKMKALGIAPKEQLG